MTKRITEPRKRTRTVQIKFWATPEEKELIEKKMALTDIVHLGAYLRKMAIDGYVVNLQIPELKDILRYQRYANNNINQIAKKVNATGNIYAEDVEEIRQRVDEALKLGACSAAASLSEVNASDGVKSAQEVRKLYDLYSH